MPYSLLTVPRRVSWRVMASPLAVGQVQQVLAAAHQINERPVEKWLVEIVGATAAPLVLPDEFAVLAGEVIEEGLHRLVQGVEETTLPHGPVGRRVERDIGGQGFSCR